MSADLFAEFGNPSSSSGPGIASTGSSADPSKRKNERYDTLITPFDTPSSFQRELHTEDSRLSFSKDSSRPAETEGNEVLFDALTEEIQETDSDDEWGEFESAKPDNRESSGGLLIDLPESSHRSAVISPPSNKQSQEKGGLEPNQVRPTLPTLDLLSPDTEQSRSPLVQKVAGGQNHPSQKTGKHVQDTPELFSSWVAQEGEEDEDWGDFTDGFEPAESIPAQNQRATKGNTSLDKGNQSATLASKHSGNQVIRPTNIPPPLILLPLFPPLLDQLQQKCSRYTSSVRGNGPEPAQPQLPREVAIVLKVMVRILIGRSLRWKRDTALSQSTKIGPARSGKPGGMKLSGVNKSESIKEDQEAVEVQDAWKRRAGMLNSVITAAGGRPVPPMAASRQVRTATADEGALKSSHACALCGLKRDERIPEVDHGVNDSFGEWWTEFWGHSECKNFWEAHSSKLDHR